MRLTTDLLFSLRYKVEIIENSDSCISELLFPGWCVYVPMLVISWILHYSQEVIKAREASTNQRHDCQLCYER